MPDDRSSSPEPASLAGEFVGALGLPDLVAGGIALYLVRLRAGADVAGAFPSTGLELVDLALLACAAALAGKVIMLGVALLMAIAAWFIEKLPYFEVVKEALTRYETAMGHAAPPAGADHAELAAEHVACASPVRRANLDRIHGSAMLAWSASVLVAFYATHLEDVAAIPGPWADMGKIASVVFALLGLLWQLSWYRTLGVTLLALVPVTTGAAGRPPG